jgi:hypothetical protein
MAKPAASPAIIPPLAAPVVPAWKQEQQKAAEPAVNPVTDAPAGEEKKESNE